MSYVRCVHPLVERPLYSVLSTVEMLLVLRTLSSWYAYVVDVSFVFSFVQSVSDGDPPGTVTCWHSAALPLGSLDALPACIAYVPLWTVVDLHRRVDRAALRPDRRAAALETRVRERTRRVLRRAHRRAAPAFPAVAAVSAEEPPPPPHPATHERRNHECRKT